MIIIADNISMIRVKLPGCPKPEGDDYPYALRIELVAQTEEDWLDEKKGIVEFNGYSEKQINQLYSALMTFLTSGTFLDAESERLFKGEYPDSFYIRKAKKGNWL